MEILQKFEEYIYANHLINNGDKVLLAVSGGKDSMLMLWLFIQAGIPIEVAHCNFNLRGKESDADEQLVRDYTAQYNIPLHVKHFNTAQLALEKKISIQLAARDLRYSWFQDLKKEKGLQSIAIAQHKNDHVETLLFNLSRGTGLRGLAGIRRKRSHIVRPLLFLDSNEIIDLVQKYRIPFRDDASNFSNKYARNKIRLDIIPEFEKLNTNFIQNMNENIVRFQESIDILDDFVSELRQQIFIPIGDNLWSITKKAINGKKLGLLYLLFEPFNFNKNVLEDLLDSLNKESGRIFEADTYEILNDRDCIILRKKQVIHEEVIFDPNALSSLIWGNFQIESTITDDCTIVFAKREVKIDYDKLIFPLVVRSWQKGDSFYPLGMGGKKKLSDLFVQQKINIFQKQTIPIVCNGNGDIMWVGGIQLDDRYKITKNTKKVLKLVLNNL